ncbi:MAG: methylenetetrahydrofolate reductase, partial [Nitrosopumilus sp.]|nr:methylenetetrahydrofolate reductase [Nitrosopumilus sp.]
NRYNIDAVPHIICGGFTKEETENALIDLNFLGINNVLVIRGDAIKTESTFSPEPGGHSYATELLEQVVNMNNGIYIDEDLRDVAPTNFCIGVAGYPEKHFEAPNYKSDLKYLKQKIDSGADYVVTQMFYDNKKFLAFVEDCKNLGINVPIIPGLKILTSKKQIATLPKIFHIEIPEELHDEVEKCNSDQQVRQVGMEWAISQSKELIKAGAPCLHYYTMGNPETTLKVAKAVF